MKWPQALPSQCLVCHAWPCAQVVCSDCLRQATTPAWRCAGCALALPGLGVERPRCGACLRQPPPWHSAHAWVDYSYPWNHLITRWKFAQQPALARHFAHWMQQQPALMHTVHEADMLIPIPMSPERMRERGYNPAAQLAQHLCRAKCSTDVLYRTRHTVAQSQQTRAQRLRNLRDALAVHPARHPALQGLRVLLVDDVMTTGATLTVATQCLLHAGAAQVQVLSLARTP